MEGIRRILRRIVASGALSALAMNACLFLLPIAGANLHRTFFNPDVFAFAPTPAALAATRADVERAALRLLPEGVDRRRGWEELVGRELREGDPHAARGFVLSARTLLGGSQAQEVERRLGADPSDAEIAAAAATLLSNETRDAFSEAAGWMARDDANPDPAAFLASGRTRDFATQADAWLAGRDDDHLALVLTGLHIAYGRELPARVVIGASALKDARRAGRLGRELAGALEQAAAAAAPPERLRAALQAASTASADMVAAFDSVVDAAALEVLCDQLEEVGGMAAATSSRGAGRLLAQARTEGDLPRLRLVAQASGDRAVAVAKRLTHGEPLANAAHGTITWTRAAILDALAFGLIALTTLAAAGAVLTRRALKFWRLRALPRAR